MKKLTALTDLEVKVATAFAQESLNTCGCFDENENISYMNVRDLVEETGLTKHVVAGVMSALNKKLLICDCMESYRKANINDWIGCPETFLLYPQLSKLVGVQ